MLYINMNPMQLDALREVGNIGAGNAATALSQLLNKEINMTVPSVNIVPFDDVFSDEGTERVVVSVIVRVLGDTPGNILFVMDRKTAFEMIKSLTGEDSEQISEMGSSVLCEIGNIIAASYMNAITQFTGLTITPSVPALTCDMFGAILSTSFIEAGQFDEQVLDIETKFLESDNNKEIGGHFYYIPMPGSLERILSTLGVK